MIEQLNIYKGHRYVPKIMGEWNQSESYEGLSIVTNQGDSYTSKKRVPIGVELSNEDYWVVTGNYNAQIEQYRQDVKQQKENVQAEFENRAVNVKSFGAVGDGIADDTDAFTNALNASKNVFVPPGKYLIERLFLNAENMLFGLNPATTKLISKDNVLTGAFIEVPKNAYSTCMRNITLVASRITPLDCGILYSDNGNEAVQDSRHIAEHIVVDGFKINFKVDSYTRGGYFEDIKSLGALDTGFDIRGTDNMFVSCLSAGAWFDGFFVIGANNRIMNCKSYLAGRSLVKGSGYRFNGSFTIASNLEAQENKFESFYFYNCNNGIFNGLLADGSGVYMDETHADLQYQDTEFNVKVPISLVRTHNSKWNVISATLINARGFNESKGKAKSGLFSLYPGLDRHNNFSLTVSDRSGDDSFETKTPRNIQNEVMNTYLINGKNLLDVPSVKSVNFTDFTYTVDNGVSVTDDTLTAVVRDNTTTTIMYTPVLQKNAKRVVFGFEKMESATLDKLQIIADLSIRYYDNADQLKYKVSSYKGFTDYSASFNVDDIMSDVTDIKSIDGISLRFRVGAKNIGAGIDHILKIKKPVLFQSVKI